MISGLNDQYLLKMGNSSATSMVSLCIPSARSVSRWLNGISEYFYTVIRMRLEDMDSIFGEGKQSIFSDSEKRCIFKFLDLEPTTRSEQVILSRVRTKIKLILSVNQSIWLDILKDRRFNQ